MRIEKTTETHSFGIGCPLFVILGFFLLMATFIGGISIGWPWAGLFLGFCLLVLCMALDEAYCP